MDADLLIIGVYLRFLPSSFVIPSCLRGAFLFVF